MNATCLACHFKKNLETAASLGDEKTAIAFAEEKLGNEGRVLVRASGTEPLVRVMLEGRDKKLTETLAQEIAQVVKERLI